MALRLEAGGGAGGCLTYQRGHGDGLAVLRGEWEMLRVRRVGIVWLAVGVRVGVLVGARHRARIERRGLHPSAYRWEGVGYGEGRLLYRHGHHY